MERDGERGKGGGERREREGSGREERGLECTLHR